MIEFLKKLFSKKKGDKKEHPNADDKGLYEGDLEEDE